MSENVSPNNHLTPTRYNFVSPQAIYEGINDSQVLSHDKSL